MPRYSWRTSLALAFALACLVAGRRSAADSSPASAPTSSLSWVELPGAEGCGGAVVMARLVEENLGRHAIVAPPHADLSIEGYVEHRDTAPAWRARIVLRDSAGTVLGQREITSSEPTCDELRTSAAIVITLMIDPDAAARAPAPLPARPAPSEPASAARPPAPASPRTSAPARLAARWRVQADIEPIVAFGMQPAVSPGAALGATVRPGAVFWRA